MHMNKSSWSACADNEFYLWHLDHFTSYLVARNLIISLSCRWLKPSIGKFLTDFNCNDTLLVPLFPVLYSETRIHKLLYILFWYEYNISNIILTNIICIIPPPIENKNYQRAMIWTCIPSVICNVNLYMHGITINI